MGSENNTSTPLVVTQPVETVQEPPPPPPQEQQQQQQQQRTIPIPISTSDNVFQFLPNVPNPLSFTQCVWGGKNQEELLICGGLRNGHCYSYHTIKQKYKLICHYPSSVGLSLKGHAVIKWNSSDDVDNHNHNHHHHHHHHQPQHHNHPQYQQQHHHSINDKKSKTSETLLLSFGGQETGQEKHTLWMRYQSVWEENDPNETTTTTTTTIFKNQWFPASFTIGDKIEHMCYLCALVSGSRNHLLFIVFPPNSIQVFYLKERKYIVERHLPFSFDYSAVLAKVDNTNDNRQRIIMFAHTHIWLVSYDEIKSSFEYERLPSSIRPINGYSFFCWKNFVVLFGGFTNYHTLDTIHVYSTKMKRRTKSSHHMPLPLHSAFAILDPDQKWVHLIGGRNQQLDSAQHVRIRRIELTELALDEIETIVEYWIQENNLKMGWITEFNSIVADYLS